MQPSRNRPEKRCGLVILGALILFVGMIASVEQSFSKGVEHPLNSVLPVSPGSSTLQSIGDCGPETYPKFIYEEYVETGAQDWTHTGAPDYWQIYDLRAVSGSYSWYDQAPAVPDDQSLYSPSIILPDNESPIFLRFWAFRDLENSYSGCNDGALLEISSDSGQSWLQLDDQLLTDPYNGVIDAGKDNPLEGRWAWCGHSQDWIESIVGLDEFAGLPVQFRFRVGTNNSQSREGWYLDDLVVQSCPSAYIAQITPVSNQVGYPGNHVFHDFRLENLGLDDDYTIQLQPGAWLANLQTAPEVNLQSGQVFTVSVGVDLPETPGDQLMEDSFSLLVRSINHPDLVLQSTGISSLNVNPGLGLQADQIQLVGVPGEIVTHTFSLTNTGDVDDDFRLRVDEAGWLTYSLPNTGLMHPGEKKSVPVQVAIPTGPLKTAELVITDTFRLRAESGWSDQIGVEAASTTSTDLIAGLRINGPAFMDAFAGRPIEVTFYLANLGNFADRYLLEWSGDWLAEAPDSQTDWIAAGEYCELVASIQVPLEILDGEKSFLTLKATSQLDPERSGNVLLTIYGWKRIFLPLIQG